MLTFPSEVRERLGGGTPLEVAVQPNPNRAVAALYVQPKGCYSSLEGVDPWPESRDARTYAGPFPVVAHPPCERWCRYATGGPSHHGRFKLGDDGGCFAAALASVRKHGGVLEHPKDSQAWAHFGLRRPPIGGGWITADPFGGKTCCVEQAHYGHRARKASWLYVCGVPKPPVLQWGPSEASHGTRPGGLEGEERRKAVRRGALELMSKRERAATPPAFRDLLLEIARAARGADA